MSAFGQEEVRSVSYFTKGMEEVNLCLEEIEPSFEGTSLQVEDYEFAFQALTECIQLFLDYDAELYAYMESGCQKKEPQFVEEVVVPDMMQVMMGLVDSPLGESVPSASTHEAECVELRHLYSKFASLHTDMQELQSYCLRWLRVLKPEQYPSTPSS
jgi:hypothetical protein